MTFQLLEIITICERWTREIQFNVQCRCENFKLEMWQQKQTRRWCLQIWNYTYRLLRLLHQDDWMPIQYLDQHFVMQTLNDLLAMINVWTSYCNKRDSDSQVYWKLVWVMQSNWTLNELFVSTWIAFVFRIPPSVCSVIDRWRLTKYLVDDRFWRIQFRSRLKTPHEEFKAESHWTILGSWKVLKFTRSFRAS